MLDDTLKDLDAIEKNLEKFKFNLMCEKCTLKRFSLVIENLFPITLTDNAAAKELT